jgi:hypothetical protein
VLDNRRLKEDFGYLPDKTSEQVFAFWMQTRKQANAAKGPKA